jgi:hypothetical protein
MRMAATGEREDGVADDRIAVTAEVYPVAAAISLRSSLVQIGGRIEKRWARVSEENLNAQDDRLGWPRRGLGLFASS